MKRSKPTFTTRTQYARRDGKVVKRQVPRTSKSSPRAAIQERKAMTPATNSDPTVIHLSCPKCQQELGPQTYPDDGTWHCPNAACSYALHVTAVPDPDDGQRYFLNAHGKFERLRPPNPPKVPGDREHG